MDHSEPMRHMAPLVKERPAVCPQHGNYLARNLLTTVWSTCPACNAELLASDNERARVEAIAREDRRQAALLSGSRIPQRFVGRSFENFRVSTDAQRQALSIARDFAEDFEAHAKRGAGLVFAGGPGTGKSHLAGAILQAVMRPGVRYVTCMDMIRSVRETWRRDSKVSESEVLDLLEGLDLLVIDEVGMQYGTEGEQNILFDVLDRRYREVRPVIVLTNQDKAGFKGYVGERTFDRLSETARWVPFDWASYRPTARKAA